jgi:serine/threonine protein kinase
MSKSASFVQIHRLGAELGNYPPFTIREASRISDGRQLIVKIYCKFGQTPSEQEKVQREMQFWRLVLQPRILEIADIYDDEGFMYIVYEYPDGGDLSALIMDSTRTFTEGFARKVAEAGLKALIFLHANGIVHGGLLPANIIFTLSTDIPGWADTCRVTFFRIDTSKHSTIFTDLQDLAYTIVSIMRKRAGLLSRTFFNPEILQVYLAMIPHSLTVFIFTLVW